MPDLFHRPRRLRRTENLRALVRETRLAPEDFILPLFACAGEGIRREVSSMPGVHNLSVDEIAREATGAEEIGVKGIILFGLPEAKDEAGSGAWHEQGIVQQAVRAVDLDTRTTSWLGGERTRATVLMLVDRPGRLHRDLSDN